MDLNRYVDLYTSEAQEHLRTLGSGLLRLERGETEALEETFRAAHTIKGMSATMGYRRVAELAHALEDRLAGVRAGAEEIDAELVDALLERSDALERAVGAAVGEGAEGATPEPAAAADPAPERGTAAAEARGSRVRARHVRVDQRRLDDLVNGLGELGVLARRLDRLVAPQAADSDELRTVMERSGRLVGELQDAALAMRMVPVADVFDRFPRVVRDAARSLGKQVDFRIEGRNIELDRSILEAVADPLVHLLRNAVDHGIGTPAERRAANKPERGRLLLRAARERSSVLIQVEDDGRGVGRERVFERAREAGLLENESGVQQPENLSDDDLLRFMSRPGISTAERVTEVSGRGVGMDVVVNRVRTLGGAVDLRTAAGRGSTFSLRLPITLALSQALRVRVADEDYAIPLTHVAEAVEVEERQIARVRGREVLRSRGEVLPLVRMGSVLGRSDDGREAAAVVAELGERRIALAVTELVGREQIVIKDFDVPDGALPIFSGVTLLADGRPALVLDPVSVL